MRPVFLSFAMFLLSVLMFLPTLNLGAPIPSELTAYLPLVLMLLIMIFQMDVLTQYKKNLQIQKALMEKEQELERLKNPIA